MEDVGWTRGKRLGKGSFGQVFIANPGDPTLPPMAVKSAPIDKASSLRLEYEILSKFDGIPGIIQCLGDGISYDQPDDGATYDLILEYAAGSLFDLIANCGGGGIPERFVRVWTRTLLEALFSIHSAGYVHCDIKPDNVLVFPHSTGHLKIADFGLAIETLDLDDPKKSRNNFRGTPRYMPPEAVVPGKASPAMDIWALGCTVVAMLTGKPPFERLKKNAEVIKEIAKGGQPEIPNWLSDEGKDFLRKCFMRSPTYRLPAHKLLLHPFVTGRSSFETTTTQLQQQRRNQMFEQARAILQC